MSSISFSARNIFVARTMRSRAEVEFNLDAEEHHACVAVETKPPNIETTMRDPLLTPVAVGTLLLWGRINFGGAWFKVNRTQFARDAHT